MTKDYYTPQEAADKLQICVMTVYRMIKSGKLTGTKRNGRLQIPTAEVMSKQSKQLKQTVKTVKTPVFKQSEQSIGCLQFGDIQPASDQVKVRYSLKFLKWMLQMNRMISRALEAMIVFLESDGRDK